MKNQLLLSLLLATLFSLTTLAQPINGSCEDTIIFVQYKNIGTRALQNVYDWNKEIDSIMPILAAHRNEDSILLENCQRFKFQIEEGQQTLLRLENRWLQYFDGDEGLVRRFSTEHTDSIEKVWNAQMRTETNELITSASSLADLSHYGETLRENIDRESAKVKELRRLAWYALTQCSQPPQNGVSVIVSLNGKQRTVFKF